MTTPSEAADAAGIQVVAVKPGIHTIALVTSDGAAQWIAVAAAAGGLGVPRMVSEGAVTLAIGRAFHAASVPEGTDS